MAGGRRYNPICKCGQIKLDGQSLCSKCRREQAKAAYHLRRKLSGAADRPPLSSPPPLSWQEFEAMQEAPERWQRGGGERLRKFRSEPG